jgi:hypothetical protein
VELQTGEIGISGIVQVFISGGAIPLAECLPSGKLMFAGD